MDKNTSYQLTLPIADEPILQYWAKCAVCCERGYLSNTVRTALEHYIKHQSFLEIARLCVPQEGMHEYPENIVFRYNMSPDIIGWLSELRRAGISGADAAKYVLLSSISTVSSIENESLINRDTVPKETLSFDDFQKLLHDVTQSYSNQSKQN